MVVGEDADVGVVRWDEEMLWSGLFVGIEGVNESSGLVGGSCEAVAVAPAFNGVLKGDLKGFERVDAASRRRRFA